MVLHPILPVVPVPEPVVVEYVAVLSHRSRPSYTRWWGSNLVIVVVGRVVRGQVLLRWNKALQFCIVGRTCGRIISSRYRCAVKCTICDLPDRSISCTQYRCKRSSRYCRSDVVHLYDGTKPMTHHWNNHFSIVVNVTPYVIDTTNAVGVDVDASKWHHAMFVWHENLFHIGDS